jgi:predicted membrane protein
MREIFALTVASASIAILFALGYLLTGWNPENFKDDVLNIVLTLLVIIVGIASSVLVFGFRPRVVKFFEHQRCCLNVIEKSGQFSCDLGRK